MLLYALTIFLSAFLLFQVQPLISKFILPWFGGTPGVWTTAMLFFQVLLLGGYAYAHVVATKLDRRKQAIVHMVVLALAVVCLPIIPGERWKPSGEGNPAWQILVLLAACVGMPYFVLATTSPLMQAWFSRTHPGRSPYRLYALSNVGSLLALLTFPFVFEPTFTLRWMGIGWSVAFGGAVLLSGYCAVRMARPAPAGSGECGVGDAECGNEEGSGGSEIRTPKSETRNPEEAPSPARWLMWLLLPACGSTMFLAVTNQMCLDIAVVPFFWVLPLSLYLLSFIICFDNERWYFRPVWWAWLGAGVLALLWLMRKGVDAEVNVKEVLGSLGPLGRWVLEKGEPAVIWGQIAGYSFGLFGCCMVCHGELVRLKPSPRHLTSFYLMVSAGGALGGLFVSLLAPKLFTTYLEFHIGLWATCALAMVAWWMDKRPHLRWPVPWYDVLRVTAFFLAGALILIFAPFPWLRLGDRPVPAEVLLTVWALMGLLVANERLFAGLRGPQQWAWLAVAGYFLLLCAALCLAPFGVGNPEKPTRLSWLLPWRRPEHAVAIWAVLGVVALAIWWRAWLWVLCLPGFLAALVYVGVDLGEQAAESLSRAVTTSRNFYGVLKVTKWQEGDPVHEQLILSHGRINHGAQLTSKEGRSRPITYFGESSGIGLAILHCMPEGAPRRIGVLGLGTGTIAAYGNAGDVYRFYEINPRVKELSGRKGVDAEAPIFTYLTDTEADCRVILGDGRLSLERQESQQFDVLAMDAFSSDAVPVHLLTKEAFDIYKKHIKPSGIIAVNVTNRFVDLRPVVRAQAERLGMKCVLIRSGRDSARDIYWCSWMLVTNNEEFLLHPSVLAATAEREEEDADEPPPILWTDDYSNLFRILK